MPGSDLLVHHATTPLQPVSPNERIHALDVVRGFALFGVLMAYTLWNLGSPPGDTYGPVDRVLDQLLPVLIDTKFYTLFAFLFGLGFSIQLTRAGSRGVSIVPVYSRRLLALLLIGLTHALLLRNGDILVPYAVMGWVLLFFRNASSRTILLGAIVGLIFPYLVRGIWNLTGIPFPQRPDSGGLGYLAENFAWVRYWYATALVNWPASLPMFLFGLYVGKRRFFENLAANRAVLRRILVAGLAAGVLAYGIRAQLLVMTANSDPSFALGLAWRLLWSAHAWGLAAFYASSLILLMQNPSWQRRLAPIGAVGRMALTNYLLQAAIIVPVCLGFDLFDRVTPSLGILLGLAVWSVQVPFSVWWMKHFRFGPAEWIWRSMTYGRPQPMRIEGMLPLSGA